MVTNEVGVIALPAIRRHVALTWVALRWNLSTNCNRATPSNNFCNFWLILGLQSIPRNTLSSQCWQCQCAERGECGAARCACVAHKFVQRQSARTRGEWQKSCFVGKCKLSLTSLIFNNSMPAHPALNILSTLPYESITHGPLYMVEEISLILMGKHNSLDLSTLADSSLYIRWWSISRLYDYETITPLPLGLWV